MNDTERAIQADALQYARANRNRIARQLTNPDIFVPEECPVSVFMAGSPGAGKTEASLELISEYERLGAERVLRIDPDELRCQFPGYDGANSWLFQGAVSLLVERIHDLALRQSQSFLLDGTLSSYEVAAGNVRRSVKRGRLVQVLYVYQDPRLAWAFVTARERSEGRRILQETFVDQYFAAREVVNRLKQDFGKGIRVDLLLKNNDGSHRMYKAGVDRIDNHVPEKYSRTDVERLIGGL